MSNRAVLEPTKFISVRSGRESYGYRFYDDYAGTYCNNLDSIPEDDLEFLKLVMESGLDEVGRGIMDFIIEEEHGVYIGDTWYEWDKIKHVFDL